MLGYARICWEARIWWDMLGYGDMMGYSGICWDMVGFVRGGSARGEKPLHMLSKAFLFIPHGFYT